MKFSSNKKMRGLSFDSSVIDHESDDIRYDEGDEQGPEAIVSGSAYQNAIENVERETDQSVRSTPTRSGHGGQAKGLAHIGQLLHTVVALDDWKIKLLQGWPTIVGGLVEYVRLEKIDRHVVVLGVYDSSWMQELRMIAPSLIKAMNDHVGQPCVRELKFKAQVKSTMSPRVSKGLSPAHSFSDVSSTKTTASLACTTVQRAALEKVEDEQLRSLIEDFLKNCTSSR